MGPIRDMCQVRKRRRRRRRGSQLVLANETMEANASTYLGNFCHRLGCRRQLQSNCNPIVTNDNQQDEVETTTPAAQLTAQWQQAQHDLILHRSQPVKLINSGASSEHHSDEKDETSFSIIKPALRAELMNETEGGKGSRRRRRRIIEDLSMFHKIPNPLLLLITVSSFYFMQTIHCQRSPSNQEPNLQQQNPQQANVNPNQRQPHFLDGVGPELRADPTSPLIVNKPGFETLVNILKNYANQQESANNQNINRRLPLNGRAGQVGNVPQLRPQLPSQLQPSPQQQQVSTPISIPFGGQQQAPQVQFPPGNNNRRNTFPNNQQQPNNNNQQMFVSSPPTNPYLTLNRIAAAAAAASNAQQNPNRVQQQFGGNNPNQLQPINTIPLGQQRPNANSRLNPIPNGPMSPPRGMRPLGPNTAQQFAGPQRIPLPGNYQGAEAGNMKPMAGFAPSGPPPSMAAANNAMVVVPSPPNGIGVQQPNPNKPGNQESALAGASNRTEQPERPSSATEPTVAASSPVAEVTPNGDPNDNREPSTSQATQQSPPLQQAAPSESPNVEQPPIGSVDLDRAANDERPSGVRPDSSWNPVEAASNRSSAGEQQAKNRGVMLAPSPDIVTVPPGYNPDNPSNQPQNYDIAVSAQMGGSPARNQPQAAQIPQQSGTVATFSDDTNPATGATSGGSSTAGSPNESDLGGASSSSSSSGGGGSISSSSRQSAAASIEPTSATTTDLEPSSTVPPTIAPTAVTTIIWSPPPSETLATIPPLPPSTGGRQQTELRQPTRIRDNSLLNDEPQSAGTNTEASVVYGKPQTRDSKPTPPATHVNPSPVSGQAANIESSVPASGKPFIQPVQIENQVRPFSAGAQSQQQQQQPSLLKSNNHGHPSGQVPFRPSRPLNGQSSPMHVGSGFTITAMGNQTMPTGDIQDYVAAQPPLLVPSVGATSGSQASGPLQKSGDNHNEPTISAHGGQDPASFDLSVAEVKASPADAPGKSGHSEQAAPPSTAPRIRRPTFKPKPAVPPIRIDSCIVDDDSSCDQSHNERCVTEYGISSCHCKPGYARLSQLRGYCSPISALQLSMKIDRLSDDRRLAFNHTLDNSNSEEYQYLEFEAIQAVASAFQQTPLAKQFMGARVNKFFERKGKVWVNMSVNFDLNNLTKSDKIQNLAAQELAKVTQVKQKPLGDSTIMLDGTKEAVSRLTDINECANRDLNDCSKFATCTNEFGGFQCQCLPGYEDKYQSEDKSKHGRVCLGCSASYCSNRGECFILDGQKQCKCRPNFVGSRCDYDTEVLAIAVGGSIIGIIILIITCWCLYIFNRRWKREQQKMDAMSATSGLTYNYVNSASTNSLMSPTRMIGGLHRSGGHQVGAMAANYGQRFGNAIVNGTRGGNVLTSGQQHYAPDQQAIIGSTSSGSSAASQPIGGCNPYTSGAYQQYEDAGLLIAPASTGSSEQTSPTSNSYRGIMGAANNTMLTAQMAGNAYTLSGHHHHLHHLHPAAAAAQHQMHHMHTSGKAPQLTQFHPAADYRTLNASGPMHCMPPLAGAGYESRWRTLQQDHGKQSALVGGYYLSPDMLVGQHQQQNAQQMYASPQRELCIDIGHGQNGNKNNGGRKQHGRSGSGGQTLRSRMQNGNNRNSMYHNGSEFHEHERPM